MKLFKSNWRIIDFRYAIIQLKIMKQNIENTVDLYDVFNGVEMYMNFYIEAYEVPNISPDDVRDCDSIAYIKYE